MKLFSNLLGPVVQSIVNLMGSLRGQLIMCFKLYYPIPWYFLLKKWEKLLHCKSFSHFFQQNIFNSKFKILTFEIFFCKMLTNDVVSFEQPGPGVALFSSQCTDRRDIENTLLVSFDIKFIRWDQKQRRYGEDCRASQTYFLLCLINLISKDTCSCLLLSRVSDSAGNSVEKTRLSEPVRCVSGWAW